MSWPGSSSVGPGGGVGVGGGDGVGVGVGGGLGVGVGVGLGVGVGVGVGVGCTVKRACATCLDPHATAVSTCGPGGRTSGVGMPWSSPAGQNGALASVRRNAASSQYSTGPI